MPFAVYGSYTMGRYSSSDCIEMQPSRISFIYDRAALAGAGKAARNFPHGPRWRMSVHGLITPGGDGTGAGLVDRTKARVLICDDDPLLLELIEFRLRAKGYEVIKAVDGAEALAKAEQDRPDIIVLDAMMPKADGIEVLARIKGDPALSETLVVMLTARKAEKDIVSALEKGADDYLVKPFIPEELLARLARLLARRSGKP
ncbi:response regulator [Mesorhizobium sp. M0633]|uniref:response regulator transcription factor n=1 Tax=Mesorhizobium sp. M0633 TaxID=2956977 RepID=UPI003335B335